MHRGCGCATREPNEGHLRVPSFPSCTAIARAQYDAYLRRLHIWYRGPIENHYIYFGVPLIIYEQLLEAPSKGRYVAAYVHSRYGYTRR
jgi:hypothetical protein